MSIYLVFSDFYILNAPAEIPAINCFEPTENKTISGIDAITYPANATLYAPVIL